jgi:hypothetical protein
MAFGNGSELWTLERATAVIEQVSDRYHPAHIWRLLKGRGWSWPKPARWAMERDEDGILSQLAVGQFSRPAPIHRRNRAEPSVWGGSDAVTGHAWFQTVFPGKL